MACLWPIMMAEVTVARVLTAKKTSMVGQIVQARVEIVSGMARGRRFDQFMEHHFSGGRSGK
jgi:hypothetical protein